MPDLEQTIAFALEAHRGQRDKNGQPYILHPLRVMFRCDNEEQRIVAMLHDVVEDTGRTFDDLRRMGYSEAIIAALDCVTKREGELYEDFIERSVGNAIARKVKLADLEDNMDVRRLPGFTEKDMTRLNRYARAYKRLKEHG